MLLMKYICKLWIKISSLLLAVQRNPKSSWSWSKKLLNLSYLVLSAKQVSARVSELERVGRTPTDFAHSVVDYITLQQTCCRTFSQLATSATRMALTSSQRGCQRLLRFVTARGPRR
jgi:hypothetical protein